MAQSEIRGSNEELHMLHSKGWDKSNADDYHFFLDHCANKLYANMTNLTIDYGEYKAGQDHLSFHYAAGPFDTFKELTVMYNSLARIHGYE